MRSAQSLTVQTKNGSLHALQWAHENPNAPIVLCLHGLLQHAGCFEELAQELTDFNVFSLDVRGRGHSDWSGHSTYEFSVYVSDVLQMMEQLNLSQISIVGTSMGGLIGMLLAEKYPEKIRALVMNDIGPVLGLSGLERITRYLTASHPRFANENDAVAFYIKVYSPFNLAPERLHRLAQSLILPLENGTFEPHYDPAITTAFFHNLESEKTDTRWKNFEAMQCPLLVLRGETSDLFTEEILVDMLRRYKGKSITSYTEPVTGHAPFLNQEQTIDVVRNFLHKNT